MTQLVVMSTIEFTSNTLYGFLDTVSGIQNGAFSKVTKALKKNKKKPAEAKAEVKTQSRPLDDSVFLSLPDEQASDGQGITLSFSRSPTVLLQFAAGRFTRSASRLYQKKYDLGATDWRMLVMLTRVPGASVTQAAETIGIDKAAVSRALKRLEDHALVTQETPENDARRRTWTLTPLGERRHTEILDIALKRQRKLLEGFSDTDVRRFTEYLLLFLGNLEELDDEKP